MRELDTTPAWEARLQSELSRLEEAGNLRRLTELRAEGLYLASESGRYLNLSSNDYLGLTASAYAALPLEEYWDSTFGASTRSPFRHGNPASRLMTGNSPEYGVLEAELAALYPGRDALVLSCGYMVNAGLMPALAGADDLILADKLVHASIIEGLQHTAAPFRRFRHNDVSHLEHLLRGAKPGQLVWVILESVYSMDGDLAPLEDILALRERYDFRLYVDEAHAFGVRGPNGAGYCAELGCDERVDLLVCTFGKALAGAGACVICSPAVKRYLVNKMRPLIFSTALPPCTLEWDAAIVHEMRCETLAARGYPSLSSLRARLGERIRLFGQLTALTPQTQIVPLPAGSNDRALELAERGREAGFWLTAIRHPTVPPGSARIRLSLNAALSDHHLHELAALCNKLG